MHGSEILTMRCEGSWLTLTCLEEYLYKQAIINKPGAGSHQRWQLLGGILRQCIACILIWHWHALKIIPAAEERMCVGMPAS